MQPVHHYIRLTQQLPHAALGQPVPITSDEVANILCCTPRNAKLILKKLTEQNWMHWQPGRGRGNTSLLTLQIAPSDLLFSLAQELVKAGDIRAAAGLIEPYTTELPDLRTRYETWLSSHFGYQAGSHNGSGAFDTLRVTHSSPLFYLDPALAMLRSESHLVKHLFDTLVTCDAANGTIRPHLAHDWEVSDDGTLYTFYLRKGVLFHNGAPLTASDAVFSFTRMQTDSFYPWMFAEIMSLTALNDRTLQIRLRAPNQLFLNFLCSERAGIVPRDYCTKMGSDFARLPVGSGPFKVIRNDETMLVLEAFVPYFRERAFLDRIEIWIVPGLDLPVPNGNYEMKYGTGHPDWATTGQLEKSFQMLTFNLNKPGPQHHPAFREALTLLFHKQQLITDLGGTRFAPASRFDPALEELGTSQPLPDLEQVRERLRASGYNGEPLLLATFADVDHIEDAEWMQSKCAGAGIPLTIRLLSYREMIAPENIQGADLILDGATIEDDTEMAYLDLLLTPIFFLAEHINPELRRFTSETVQTLLQKTDRQERLALLQEIETRLLAQKAVLPLYRTWTSVSSHPSLHGVTMNTQGWVNYRDLWFKALI